MQQYFSPVRKIYLSGETFRGNFIIRTNKINEKNKDGMK